MLMFTYWLFGCFCGVCFIVCCLLSFCVCYCVLLVSLDLVILWGVVINSVVMFLFYCVFCFCNVILLFCLFDLLVSNCFCLYVLTLIGV